jgi:hypothetical protein
MKILTTTLIILMMPLLRHGAAQADLRRVHTPPPTFILERIHKLTDLDTLFPVKTIEDAPASTASIPFLEKELEGKTAIKVTLKRGKLKLKTSPGQIEIEDKYNDRQFVVLLDSDAKKLLSVTSRISKKDPDIHPERSARQLEEWFRNAGELYQSFPTMEPKINFLEALEKIEGFGDPMQSQEIDEFYVMYLESDGSRPEWIITLRGFPPYPSKYGSEPVWSRNHMRSSADASTGRCLSATSNPQPNP